MIDKLIWLIWLRTPASSQFIKDHQSVDVWEFRTHALEESFLLMESWATIQGKSSRVRPWRCRMASFAQQRLLWRCETTSIRRTENGRRDPKTPFGPRFFSGGWFGCHQFYVPIYKGLSSSSRNWRSHIFQRGGLTQAPSSFSFSPNPRGIEDAYGWHGWQWWLPGSVGDEGSTLEERVHAGRGVFFFSLSCWSVATFMISSRK